MHDEDAAHPNKMLQQKLQHIYELRRETSGRVNFKDASFYNELLLRLGDPHKNLPPVIHIAGTNGKGSVLATLQAILQAGGYKVHSYTSPHLLKFNERINLAGTHITDEALESLLDEVFEKNADNPVTFFEFTTAMAFLAFTRTPADIVLLETGMGGRLDCTNIIDHPLLDIITPVSYDHMQFLGNTIPEIAGEKAGIMKRGASCLLGPQTEEALGVFRKKALETGSALYVYDADWTARREENALIFESFGSLPRKRGLYPLPNLIGAHQIDNTGTALAALELISKRFPVSEDAKSYGLKNIRWPGRMERKLTGRFADLLHPGWELWFDCGHNVAGAQTVAAILEEWQKTSPKPLHILLGMREGKDIKGVISILRPYASSLSEFEVGTDLVGPVTSILDYADPAPSRILICGSLYNYF